MSAGWRRRSCQEGPQASLREGISKEQNGMSQQAIPAMVGGAAHMPWPTGAQPAVTLGTVVRHCAQLSHQPMSLATYAASPALPPAA